MSRFMSTPQLVAEDSDGVLDDAPDEERIRQRLAALAQDALPPPRDDASDEIDELMASIKAESEAHAQGGR